MSARPNPHRRRNLYDYLRERDGDGCFYCGEEMVAGAGHFQTFEHLHSRSDGGNNDHGNLVLAGFTCNQRAKNLSVVDKIKLRDTIRAEKALALNTPETIDAPA